MSTKPRRADTELLEAAARGNHAAFDTLVRRHTNRMYRVALRVVGDSAEAEDIVQDAWMAAWRALGTFRGEAAVSTWLYRVVTNTALAHLRKNRPVVSLDTVLDTQQEDDKEGAIAASTAFGDHTGDPERHALRDEQVSAVLRAINALEPSQRLPLVLRELEGLSYEEIAVALDVSVPALRSRLHRARVALLAKLKELR